eukprot:4132556-Karenia_brevis.AAC.1
MSQRSMSTWIEKADFESAHSTELQQGQRRLQAAAAPHAGAFLTATPSPQLGLQLTNAEFASAVKLRLGVPVSPCDSWCPMCDQVLDTKCFHAVSCSAGGHRTTRHNALRDIVFRFAKAAGVL